MPSSFSPAAAALLAEQARRLPDLSAVVVLVPHHHLARPFLAALHEQAAHPVMRPPRILTLPDLASCVGASVIVQPDSLRLAEIYAWLRRLPWLSEAGRWPTAQALHALLREMDDALLAPPDDYAGFTRQVERVSRRLLSRPLQDEARLVFEVWRAFHAGAPGERGAYALGLAQWLDTARGPLYSLGLQGLSRLEQDFLRRCEARLAYRVLPVEAPNAGRADYIQAAWQAGEGELPLRERARAHAQAHPRSPVEEELVLRACPDLESLARLAAGQIRLWLAEGRRQIGVIALDRLAARRLRAVLERDQVLMQDETGWTFSTAAVSHVLDRWLDLVAEDAYYRHVLDLLKSVFLFADVPQDARMASVHALERALRQEGVSSGIDRLIGLARRHGLAGVLPLLERLQTAAREFSKGQRLPLGAWLQRLLGALDSLGTRTACEADTAGRQLLELLRRLGRELAQDRTRYGFGEWRAWLTLQLDTATFLDDAVESPVRLTHLAAARLREFEAVILLGADAARLPPRAPAGVFNDALRVELGLPGQSDQRDESLAALQDVLCRTPSVLAAWQERGETGPNPPSPWLEVLDLFHRLAYGRGLRLDTPVPGLADAGRTAGAAAAPPAPRAGRVPERLSASAWQTLVSCPYRYFARYDLGLGEEEVVAEEMEKRDYGELVHAILARFHGAHPRLEDYASEALLADLLQTSRAEFAHWLEAFPLAVAWLQRWEKRLPGYLDWALEREAQGHRWNAAEQRFEQALEFGDGRTVRLEGRIDRIDAGPQGCTVLDYKTQSRSTLQRKLKLPGEDVQLPFYGLLTGAAEAAFVSLDDEKITALGLPGDLAEAAQAEAGRLAATLATLAAGAAMPAQGAPETCRWCEMRGLCRRDHWQVVSAPRPA